MQEYETGAVRDTGGKGRMDLLPWNALIRVSKHMEDALTHYPERNWEKGLPMHSMIDSAFRHLAKYMCGMEDEDHLCAAATNLLMAMWTEESNPDMQDIPSRSHEKTSSLASGPQVGREPAQPRRSQGRANGTQRSTYPAHVMVPLSGCSCYDSNYEVCNGTKERERCTCGGNPAKCDFYSTSNAKQR